MPRLTRSGSHAAAALILLCAYSQPRGSLGQLQSCLDESQAVKCDNCDFKQDIQRVKDNEKRPGAMYAEVVPTLWTGASFIALSGNPHWDPNETPGGVPFVGLFCSGSQLSRSFTGLVPGGQYIVSFLAAERKGYGSGERMSVRVNGEYIAEKFSPVAAWVRHTYTFTPNKLGVAVLEFVNASPMPVGGGCYVKGVGATVFLGDVKIYAERDCGHGAACHEPLPPSNTYTCRCNPGGTFLGKAVVGGQANCTKRDSLSGRVDGVEGQIGAVEKGVLEVVGKVRGLQDSLARTDKAATAQGDAQDTAAADMTDLKARMSAVEGQLAALVAALQAGKASEAALAVAEEPSPNPRFQASITAEGGGVDVALQEGRHLSVNGAIVLTAAEVTTLIRDAVAGALVAVGDAV